MTHPAIPAPRRGHCPRGPGKDDDLCGTPKGQTVEKRRRARPTGNNDIRDRGLRRVLRPGSKETFNEAL
jgi:hypothetical protein